MLARPTSYRIDGTGLYTAHELADGTVRWPMVRAIEELGPAGMALARVGKAMIVPIPANGLAPDVRAALLTFTHAHVGAPDIPPPPAPGAVAAGVPVDFRPPAYRWTSGRRRPSRSARRPHRPDPLHRRQMPQQESSPHPRTPRRIESSMPSGGPGIGSGTGSGPPCRPEDPASVTSMG